MSHESNTTTLGSGAEEGNLGLLGTEFVGIKHHAVPGGGSNSVLVVLDGGEMNAESGISLDNTSEADLHHRDQGRAKVTTIISN